MYKIQILETLTFSLRVGFIYIILFFYLLKNSFYSTIFKKHVFNIDIFIDF